MDYDDITCGIRVSTPKGLGDVVAFDAKMPEFRELFGDLAPMPNPLMATIKLDSGSTVQVSISKLSKEVSDE